MVTNHHTKPVVLKASTALTPMGLVNEQGNYVLQHEDIIALLRYSWTGVLLPTDEAGYQKRITFTDTQMKDFKSLVDFPRVLSAYKNTHDHCSNFKDNIYTNIVSLADLIYNYATTAGGELEGSYYANIISYAQKLIDDTAHHAAAESINEDREVVRGLIDAQMQSIAELSAKTDQVVSDLTQFEEAVKSDQAELQNLNTSFENVIKNKAIGDIDTKIKEQRDKIADDTKEWEKDVILATTALSYASLFPFGTIAAAVVIGVYSDKAIKMKAEIDALNTLISQESSQKIAYINACAEMNAAHSDIDAILEQIGPAIHAIELMQGYWHSISGDLQAVRDMVDKSDKAMANSIIVKISQKAITGKWNTLADRVDAYRQIAFVSEPEQVTLKQMSDALGKQIQAKRR